MTLHHTITRLATDYASLPDLLPTDTAPRMPTEGRAPTRVHSPVPLRVDVSDLIRDIWLAAWQFEAALREELGYGLPYWTSPTPRAVPSSLLWTAGEVDQEDTYTEATLGWVAAVASGLEDRCIRVQTAQVRVVRNLRDTCPRCGSTGSLFGRTDTQAIRCIRCTYQEVVA